MNTVRVVMSGHGHGKVFIDGVEQTRVLAFKIECGVGEINRLTMTTVVDEVEIVCDECAVSL
ncbi:MAG TPA: hypothetical protein VGV14_01555 [Rhodanobacter sp.]|nr:hypothetical protein [Rhodanobacter sp.]